MAQYDRVGGGTFGVYRKRGGGGGWGGAIVLIAIGLLVLASIG